MRKILKIIIISVVLSSCGYNPILVNKEKNLYLLEMKKFQKK